MVVVVGVVRVKDLGGEREVEEEAAVKGMVVVRVMMTDQETMEMEEEGNARGKVVVEVRVSGEEKEQWVMMGEREPDSQSHRGKVKMSGSGRGEESKVGDVVSDVVRKVYGVERFQTCRTSSPPKY